MNFWEQPLETLDRAQWEALCDGCGKCCLHKVEDFDTGRIYPTNVACRLLDTQSGQCSNYRHRRAYVPDCLRLTPAKLAGINWLPETCAYVRRAEGKPLPDWHYLICGDREAIHEGGHSVRGRVISETLAGDLENHIVEQPL
ncbi:YcgN family cysteine cluster protein [Sphingobium nicotianae]|uniref:YcgN family cysteine cluster protein n=1 Tax=Sphingobium nicotianae TaxID=2782607 RepID=A0A9X1DA91_9SPHN|nr:YcgN family cysteine cluster protein [Sphingobium nicotianae]MBT2186287.1 YcgN family cysteine cluster protein [Sphingobium nicotianae]